MLLSIFLRRDRAPTPEAEASVDIEALYRDYAPLVYRRILRFYDAHEAEEVLHEVFIKVIERAESFRHESAPTTWLYRVATNHCINRLRDSKRRRELLVQHHDDLFPSSERSAAQHDKLFWRELWQHIDAELLQLAVFYYIDGLSHEEIARIQQVSRRTIGNRLEELQRQVKALTEL